MVGAIVATTLWAATGPAFAVDQPGQPPTGYGSPERYVSAGATEHQAGSALAGTKVWWYVPDTLRDTDSAPVVVMLHGFALLAPDIYQGHIDHLTRQGYVVVYPQINLAFPGLLFDNNQNTMMSRAIDATNTALAALGSRRGPLHLYGHSLGGLLAASWAGSGGPATASVTIANPSTGAGGPFGGTGIDWPTRAAATTAPTVILTGDADTIAPSAQSVDLFAAMTGASSRIVYQARTDTYGSPDLDADHMAPIQDDGIIPSFMMDFLGGNGEQDAMDFRYYYAALDAQLDGRLTVPFAMGAWGDGRPVATPVVLAEDVPPTGVAGTVTSAGSAAVVPGAWVAVLDASDFSIVGAAVADTGGDFSAAVPPGSYFVYVIDPAGLHAAGFHGGPTTVDVAEGTVVDIDPRLAATTGSVVGSVTEDGSGDGLSGAFVIAISGATGAPERVGVADGSGQFALSGLAAGTRFVAYLDPSGGHAPRFAGGTPSVVGSTPVTVAAGAATTADGSLPVQALTPTGVALSGTVTESASGVPLPGVMVIALREADFGLARATTTDAAGTYALDVSPGAYKLAFLDASGDHDMEWHDDQPFDALAAAGSISAPAVTDAALPARTGTIAGTITDDPSGAPLPGAWVVAIRPTGGIAGGAVAAADGTFTLAGLATGTYRVAIVDATGAGATEYWDNSATYEGSTPVVVTGGLTTSIDPALAGG